MFRAEVASGSQRGQIIDKYISAGNIVLIDIAIETILGAIKRASTDVVIIDGYPRSVEQMVELDKYLVNESEVELVNVIEVDVSQETAFQRVIWSCCWCWCGKSRWQWKVFLNRMKLFLLEPLEDIGTFTTKKLLKISGETTIKEIVDEMDALSNQKSND